MIRGLEKKKILIQSVKKNISAKWIFNFALLKIYIYFAQLIQTRLEPLLHFF